MDGKHVVFGEVVEGMEIVKQAERCGRSDGRPEREVIIYKCGDFDEKKSKKDDKNKARGREREDGEIDNHHHSHH